MQKFELSVMNIIILICLAILKVNILTKFFKEELEYVYYENNFISIDIWSLIHVINNILILNLFNISLEIFIGMVIGWEILENLIIPSIFPSLTYFKETKKNIIGDIITAIPAITLKQYEII